MNRKQETNSTNNIAPIQTCAFVAMRSFYNLN